MARNDAANGKQRAKMLVLYVAGNTASSQKARANLQAIVGELEESCKVSVIDVLKAPHLALQEGIFATPSLTAGEGKSKLLIIGDLSDRHSVLSTLRG